MGLILIWKSKVSTQEINEYTQLTIASSHNKEKSLEWTGAQLRSGKYKALAEGLHFIFPTNEFLQMLEEAILAL